MYTQRVYVYFGYHPVLIGITTNLPTLEERPRFCPKTAMRYASKCLFKSI